MSRGSIATFPSYRPPCPWDIFSCPNPPDGPGDEDRLTDGVSYNHNGRAIPASALKALIFKKPGLFSECGAVSADDVDKGRATGVVFVSEREDGLETLHVALRFNDKVEVRGLAEIYGADTFGGVRMEDSGCFGGGGGGGSDPFIVYVSTKKAVKKRRTPWTVVYKTNLRTGETEALTPDGEYDLSPAVSPSGNKVAVANFRGNGWTGEIEHLNTDIVVMSVDGNAKDRMRLRIIEDAGWPSWGTSDNVIFFHRAVDKKESERLTPHWGVYRYDIAAGETKCVTPVDADAMTPAAISDTQVAVAIIRRKINQMAGVRDQETMYRHIEVFHLAEDPDQPPVAVKVTQNVWPKADHYGPFVLDDGDTIGYHRANTERLLQENGTSNVAKTFGKLRSPLNGVDVLMVSGVFPTVSPDGSKLAFVDNEFKAIWLATADEKEPRVVHEFPKPSSVFSTVWNQNPDEDTLYLCVGPAFDADSPAEIHAICNVSGEYPPQYRKLTNKDFKRFNNAFPSSNPEGTKIVFRSTRHAPPQFKYKNLYIMDAMAGDSRKVTRLTEGEWTDTHCQWSPNGKWIVFSSTRDKPSSVPKLHLDNSLDLGHFAVFLLNPDHPEPEAVVRVITSAPPSAGPGSLAGHVNHPMFSPDGRSIVVTSDLAAVSIEPISMPMFLHSVRPYGDIFAVDIDPDDIEKNRDIQEFHRVTHSRYEYATPVWTKLAIEDPRAPWDKLLLRPKPDIHEPACPYMLPKDGKTRGC